MSSVDPNIDQASQPAGEIPARRGYRRYVLAVMFCGFTLNLFDRQIIGILLQPIKEEFLLSDTALGLLSGLAFALFYAVLGVPIAKLSDKYSRRKVIAVCMALWSAMTALGGVAQSAWQLILTRAGVGVGEAGYTPAAMSMLSDYYPKEERIVAMSIVNLGPIAGIMLGLMVGGWAAELFGWRGALFLAGIPGVLFAVLFYSTVREPMRGILDKLKDGAALPPSSAAASFWRVASYRWIVLGAAFFNFCLYSIATWMPAMLQRTHGLGPADAGLILGPVFGICGAIGTLSGGWFAQKLSLRDARWALWMPAAAAALCAPLVVTAFLSTALGTTVWVYAAAYLLSFFYLGPTFAIVQSLVPAGSRARATAWMMLVVNLVGLGLGPQFVGILSDVLTANGSGDPLRYALAVVGGFFLIPAVTYCLAARTYRDDQSRAGQGIN